MQTPVTDLIDSWPDFVEFAKDLGLKRSFHGRLMRKRGRIPRAYWHDLVAGAKKRKIQGITLSYLEKIHAGVGKRRS